MIEVDREYRIGLRAIKTAVAVFLCLVVDRFILHSGSVLFSAVAAVVCMQQTSEKSITAGWNRFIGTIIGGIYGFFVLEGCAYFFPNKDLVYLLIIPVCMLGAIYVCNAIQRKDSVSICCIVFLSIVTDYQRTVASTLTYVMIRILETTIGIVISVMVNAGFKSAEEKELQKKKEKRQGENQSLIHDV